MDTIKKYLWLSQMSLVSLLVLCCLVLPSVVIKNGGVSNFGNHDSTIVFYILSFSLEIVFLYLASIRIRRLRSGDHLANLFILLCFLNLLVLISTFPRHISYTFSEVHDYLGIALFLYELFLSIWFLSLVQSSQAAVYLVVEILGSLIGLLSILKVIHFLFVGQFFGAVGFGLILVFIFPEFLTRKVKLKK